MMSKPTQRFDVKKKLMAAISMLLVSAIMLVSTTYAWFTLSTAPEVTGIDTTVGANGNLEIALSPADGQSASITSAVGDSSAVKEITASNITWGNLVDLSSDAYGLENISLMPARLNIKEGTVAGSPLLTAGYGDDGRVSELLENTVTGIFTSDTSVFAADSTMRGVRAIGTASGLTDRQLAYRNARSNMAASSSAARSEAARSLNAHGSDLADIVVQHVLGDGTETYDVKYLTTLQDVTATLESSLGHVEKAIRQAILGYAASKASGLEDAAFDALKGKIETDTVDSLLTEAGITGTPINDANDKYNQAVMAVSAAKTKLDELSATSPTELTWEQIRDAMTSLVNAELMTINGYKASEFKDHINDIASDIMANGLTVSVPTGAGVYADLADLCGDYTASIVIAKVSYGGLELSNVPAKMNTATTVTPTHLSAISAALAAAGAPDGGAAEDANITDFYGYALDLFFRTNANDSKLLLQTEGVQRVYDDSTNEATQGGGSTMTFASLDTTFTNESVKALMGAIRVVFANTEDGTVYGYAKLDMDKAGVTEDGSGIEAPLYLHEVTAEEDGTLTWGNMIGAAEGEEAVITPLTQNEATPVTAWVYLDGDMVDNSMVANAEKSMTGTLNLQFASSAELNPMLNTPLKDGTNTSASSSSTEQP